MVRKLKSCKRQVDQPFVVKLKAAAVVMSLAKVSCLDENGQGDGTTDGGRVKENQVPPMLLAGSTASKERKNERTLADIRLEVGVSSQYGSVGLKDIQTRANIAKMELEGQLDVIEYSRITEPESVHMGDPAGGYVEILKARNSAREDLMA